MKDPNNAEEQQKVFLALLKLAASPPVKAFMSKEIAGTVWNETCKIADENNQPGKFTAFRSYEWTSMPGQRNLHRNIFFRGDKVPDMPFTALDSKHPEELWQWMDTQRKAGNELLAISHNANVSDGWMYPIDLDSMGRPIDAAWASARDRNERLIEIKQIKGASETHPLLSPNDEFASYEMFTGLLGLPFDVGRVDHINGSFARQALKDGLTMQDVRGYNPYKLGFGAAADSHNTGTPYRHDNFFGGHGMLDGTVEHRMAGVMLGQTIDSRLENPAGLTGVWAEENTRASMEPAPCLYLEHRRSRESHLHKLYRRSRTQVRLSFRHQLAVLRLSGNPSECFKCIVMRVLPAAIRRLNTREAQSLTDAPHRS